MNEEKAPRFSGHINRKTEVSACLYAKRNPPMVKARKRLEAVDDFAHGNRIQIHIKTNPI